MGAILFFHAINTILRNFKQALMASLIPICIGFLVFYGGYTLLLATAPAGSTYQDIAPMLVLWSFMVLVATILVFGWVAVNWHRYVLLEETPKIFPVFNRSAIFGYIGKSIKLGFWMFFWLIPVMLVLFLVALPFLGDDNQIGTGAPDYGADDALFEMIVGVVVGYIWFRYALILPAIAVGKNMTLKESREATAFHSGPLLLVSVLIALTNVFLNTLLAFVGSPVFLAAFVAWFVIMLGIGILTTLYGHLCEGRALPQ